MEINMAPNFYDIQRPAAIEEDDPLWQYYQQIKAQQMAAPVDDREYNKELRKTYREQNLMNEVIPTLAKAGANIGTVGGRTARTVLDYETPDPRATDYKYRSQEGADDLKRNLLYERLLTGLSSKIASKDKMQIEAERQRQASELARQRLEREQAERAEKLRLDAENKNADRMSKKEQAEADRALRAQMAEEDRKLREKIAKDNAALRNQQVQVKIDQAKNAPPKEPNVDQGSYAVFGQQMLDAEKESDAVIAKGYDPSEKMAAVRKIPGVYTFAATQEDRAYEAAKRKFIGAVLRKQSGAAISDQEFKREEEKYFPQAGDGPEVMAQKKAARMSIAKNFIQLGSRAAPLMKSSSEFQQKPKGDPVKARMILEKMIKNPSLLKSQNPQDVKARQYIIDSGLESELRKAQGVK